MILIKYLTRPAIRKMSTITNEIIRDHNEIRAFYNEFDKHMRLQNYEEAQKWYNQLAWEVARHSVSEEVVLYPWMCKNTNLNVETNKNQHQLVKEKFAHLEKLKIDDKDFGSLLKSVMNDLLQHMELEEKEEFPVIQSSASAEDLEKLAVSFSRRKSIVPTQAHPHAPNTPGLATVTGLLMAPFDKLQDLFKDFPSQDEIKGAKK